MTSLFTVQLSTFTWITKFHPLQLELEILNEVSLTLHIVMVPGHVADYPSTLRRIPLQVDLPPIRFGLYLWQIHGDHLYDNKTTINKE